MRSIRLYLALALLIALVTACAAPVVPPAAEGEGAAPAAESGAPIELVYMTHDFDPAVAVNEQIIQEFEEAHPNVTIVYDHSPHENYEQKILTAFAGGEGPDVFWAGDWMMPQFTENNIVAPVDYEVYGVGSAAEFMDLFDEGSLDPFTVEGEVYTGGISEYNTFSLLYNVDHFEEAGIGQLPDDEPITWQQVADYAEQLAQHDAEGNVTRNAIAWPFGTPIWTVLILEPILHQQGGQLIDPETGMPDFTSPEMISTMQYVQDLRFERNAMDPAVYTDLLDDFGNGNVSMIMAGPWALSYLDDINPDLNFDIAPLPMWEGGERVTTLYAWAWFVNPNSSPEEQRLAWEFVDLLSSHAKIWWDEVRYVQPRKVEVDGQSAEEYRVSTEPRLAEFLDDYDYGQYEFRSTAYFELSDIWTRALTRILEGEDVETVLQESQTAAEFAVEE